MSAYMKVLDTITSKHQNGHAIVNAKNQKSLAVAKKEIEKMIGELK